MRPATLGPALDLALACWGGPQPEPSPAPSPAGARGTASWYATGPVGVAAAGRALREALGPSWRGMRVRVCGPAGCARVALGDVMAAPRLVDLPPSAFRAVCGALSRGLCVAGVYP